MQTQRDQAPHPIRGVEPHLNINGKWVKYPKHSWHVDTVWHYTSVEGCYGILTNDELWASSASMLNDTGEMTYGTTKVTAAYRTWASKNVESTPVHALLRAAIDDLATSMLKSPPFVLSASMSPQLLNQWANYGDSSGCCIGLDGLGILHVIGRNSGPGEKEVLPLWLKVLYDIDEQDTYVSALLDQLVEPDGLIAAAAQVGNDRAAQLLFQNLAMLVASLKHPAFEAEQEVRFVVTRQPSEKLSFRPSARGIVPYLRLGATMNDPSGGIQIAADRSSRLPLPVSEIVIGPPRGDSEMRRLGSMREFVSANGYTPVIRSAEIPYLP